MNRLVLTAVRVAAFILTVALWHWLLRSALLLYADAGFEDLRLRPDEPWGWIEALRQLARRVGRRLRPVGR